MEKLDEKALRRPEFTEGWDIYLGDGQKWTFPFPDRTYYPEIAPDGGFRVTRAAPYGDEFQAKLARMVGSEDETPEANAERFDLQLTLAAELLSRNYALDSPSLARLLPFRLDLEGSLANKGMWDEVAFVLGGNRPKPSTVG